MSRKAYTDRPEEECVALARQMEPFIHGKSVEMGRRFDAEWMTADLAQEGWLAALHAARLWVDEGNASYTTYARKWVFGAMQDYLLNYRQSLRLPWNYKSIAPFTFVSFDAPRPAGSEAGNEIPMRVGDDDSLEDRLAYAPDVETQDLLVFMREQITQLPDRLRDIVTRRWLREEGFDEIGAAYGFTKQRAEQIEKDGLRLLRRRFSALKAA